MSEPTIDKLKDSIHQHKTLLAAANDEIEKLREQVGQCATTILETVMLEDSQGDEIKFLRARVNELEQIVAKSQEQSHEAEKVFAAMRGAMDRMQETIRKVAGQARETATAADFTEELRALEDEVAEMPDDLARLIGPD